MSNLSLSDKLSNKYNVVKHAILDASQKYPKLSILFLVLNVILFIFAVIMIIVGAVASIGTKQYNYLPPILAAAGLFLLFVIPLGLYGI
jgi:hypothetical protein